MFFDGEIWFWCVSFDPYPHPIKDLPLYSNEHILAFPMIMAVFGWDDGNCSFMLRQDGDYSKTHFRGKDKVKYCYTFLPFFMLGAEITHFLVYGYFWIYKIESQFSLTSC